MLRFLFSASLCVIILPSLVFGAPIQLIQGIPAAYTPGQPVTFDVRLPAISNLGSYNIDLVAESAASRAEVDFRFDLAATMAASTNYVFPSSTNFFDAVTKDSETRHRITLTDFDSVGANVVPGTNDRIARVVLQTASTLRGPLNLFVSAPLLILDTPNLVPTPVLDFAAIQGNIIAAGSIDLIPVPEPSSVAGLLVGLVVVLVRRL